MVLGSRDRTSLLPEANADLGSLLGCKTRPELVKLIQIASLSCYRLYNKGQTMIHAFFPKIQTQLRSECTVKGSLAHRK
ncbi:hypothetical protein F2Q70_00010742 [Brassica cretica]|uniref:Uncharacterized protein n=1 Tax=Brassica cretica TaxID=69181 RepID=A0A8S9M8A5_BRACR|nr:hypothetical protein F2Q70_00010742 [Brassica cretica]